MLCKHLCNNLLPKSNLQFIIWTRWRMAWIYWGTLSLFNLLCTETNATVRKYKNKDCNNLSGLRCTVGVHFNPKRQAPSQKNCQVLSRALVRRNLLEVSYLSHPLANQLRGNANARGSRAGTPPPNNLEKHAPLLLPGKTNATVCFSICTTYWFVLALTLTRKTYSKKIRPTVNKLKHMTKATFDGIVPKWVYGGGGVETKLTLVCCVSCEWFEYE